ncbi:hypothetical protein SEVIR_9G344201v4 [Setaria viridis]|uniref:Uncharacterized protein n=1 Tax=Setaria viridis TaxID=4556 RepID=A0A4U6T569_SETVI|nr:hypothetical protein SEVIR_9G344201v2 [Setaria viridis]
MGSRIQGRHAERIVLFLSLSPFLSPCSSYHTMMTMDYWICESVEYVNSMRNKN